MDIQVKGVHPLQSLTLPCSLVNTRYQESAMTLWERCSQGRHETCMSARTIPVSWYILLLARKHEHRCVRGEIKMMLLMWMRRSSSRKMIHRADFIEQTLSYGHWDLLKHWHIHSIIVQYFRLDSQVWKREGIEISRNSSAIKHRGEKKLGFLSTC